MNKFLVVCGLVSVLAVLIQTNEAAEGTRKEPCEDLCKDKSCMCKKGPSYTTPACQGCCNCKGKRIRNKRGEHDDKNKAKSKDDCQEKHDHSKHDHEHKDHKH